MCRVRPSHLALALLCGAIWPEPGRAGWPPARRVRTVVPTTVARPSDADSPRMLGNFISTPIVTIGGSNTTGDTGYTPLDQYGPLTTALYGPLSSFRATSAPVLTYSRGYDGVPRPIVGTSFSYPNFPVISPVVYPTRSTVRPGFGYQRTPPWWDQADTWIDQN